MSSSFVDGDAQESCSAFPIFKAMLRTRSTCSLNGSYVSAGLPVLKAVGFQMQHLHRAPIYQSWDGSL